jgi:hypothetical protein
VNAISETSTALDDLEPYGFVEFHGDGTWSPLPECDGGVQAAIEPVLEFGEIVDAVAWPMFDGRHWALRTGAATVLGYDDIGIAIRSECRLALVENPRDWVMTRGCPLAIACVLDWSADLYWIFDQLPGICCVSERLARRLTESLSRRRAPCPITVGV